MFLILISGEHMVLRSIQDPGKPVIKTCPELICLFMTYMKPAYKPGFGKPFGLQQDTGTPYQYECGDYHRLELCVHSGSQLYAHLP